MLSRDKIIGALSDMGMTPPELITYSLTDSTNERAREYAASHSKRAPAVFIADGQTAGRGRRGRSFVSNIGAGIYISFLIYPDTRGASSTEATAEAAVALSRAIEAAASCKTRIKWVNDIYLGERKLAGILAEGKMHSDGEIEHLVVGMGINIYKNAISDEIANIATSLEDETGELIDRELLAAKIIYEFLVGIGTLAREEIYREYKSRSFVIGKDVTVQKPNESYAAKVIDLSEDYSLLLRRETGEEEKLFTGEVSIRML